MNYNRIINGAKVRIRSYFIKKRFYSCGLRPIIDEDVTFTWPENITVGNYVYFNKRVFLQGSPQAHIYVGNNVFFSYDSMILTASHPLGIKPEHHVNKDVIIEDDVKVLAKALITSGTKIGRGAVVGAGAVVRNDIPPYAVVVGNPARISGFVATIDEIAAYEIANYPEDKRIDLELLEKNYNKYFLKRIKEIKEYTKL